MRAENIWSGGGNRLGLDDHLYRLEELEEIGEMYREVALMANKCAGNLVAKHPPRQCDVCGRTFVPHSGRALYCRMCRVKGYKWIKEQRKRATIMKQAQIKTEEVLRND